MLSKDLASGCPSRPSLFVGVILLFHCFVLFFFFLLTWLVCYDLFMLHFLISVNMLNNLNINSRSMQSSASSLSGLSLISPHNWYSGGRVFDPRSGHISFIEIWS